MILPFPAVAMQSLDCALISFPEISNTAIRNGAVQEREATSREQGCCPGVTKQE